MFFSNDSVFQSVHGEGIAYISKSKKESDQRKEQKDQEIETERVFDIV